MQISINRFYAEVLGAPLRNARWSWGSHDQATNQVYLRVWADEIREVDGRKFIRVLRGTPDRVSPGYRERARHLELLRNGAEGYGILCVARDPRTDAAREIESFDRESLLRFGDLVEFETDAYAEIIGHVRVAVLRGPRTSENTLASDLKAILRAPPELTEREALLSARVGQGRFRNDVLAKWDGKCAVTGTAVLDAIRASHIKPWGESSDDERLDPDNGIPLVATLDALFDAGLISFSQTGEMLLSGRISASERSILGLEGRRLSKVPNAACAAYLQLHVDSVFHP